MSGRTIPFIGLIILVISVSAAFADGICAGVPAGSPSTVLTGELTAQDGAHYSLKAENGDVYTLDADQASVFVGEKAGNVLSLRVGDTVRIYGKASGSKICAARVRVILSEVKEEVKEEEPAPVGAGPCAVIEPKPSQVEISVVGDGLGSWRTRGLVLNVIYSQKTLTMSTSTGPFVIDVSAATIVQAHSSVSVARINSGDAIRVWGETVGINKVRADRVEIIRDGWAMDSAPTLFNVSVVGVIDDINYATSTFRINIGTGKVKIMTDSQTFINDLGHVKAFMNLSIGDHVKVNGVGNYVAGFMATQVIIVGSPGGG